jgi:hypothetical protein
MNRHCKVQLQRCEMRTMRQKMCSLLVVLPILDTRGDIEI